MTLRDKFVRWAVAALRGAPPLNELLADILQGAAGVDWTPASSSKGVQDVGSVGGGAPIESGPSVGSWRDTREIVR